MINKNLGFLKDKPFFDSGLYDNKKVYENTPKAIENVIKSKNYLYIRLKKTLDNMVICYKDKNLERLLHVEDKVKDCSYEDISYIAKFPILKLSDLVEILHGTPVIFELDKEVVDYKLRIMDILTSYEGEYAIVSKDIGTLKWFNKNYPNVIIGYKIERDNKNRFHFFRKYDFILVDVNIYNDKYIRKQREEKVILGHNIRDDQTFDSKKNVYDSLICSAAFDK
jgi:hypothetical protein